MNTSIKSIVVHTKILSGNLGDDWTDNDAVANSFADYLNEYITETIAKTYGDNVDLDITIDVQHNTSGYDTGLSVYAYDENGEEIFFPISKPSLENVLQYAEDEAWLEWVNSPYAEKYMRA